MTATSVILHDLHDAKTEKTAARSE